MEAQPISPPGAYAEAQRQQARFRESRAALNFAPPDLERLKEKYIRPRQRYYDSNFRPENDELCPTCARIDLSELLRSGLRHETRDGIQIRKNIPMGYSDEIYMRATCQFCRLLVEVGDTNMSGGDRDVEFWSIITLKGHEVVSGIAEPLYDIKADDSNSTLENLSPEAIYLALVRTVKAPTGYPFEYRTLFKDSTYIGPLGADELFPSGSFALRETGDAAEMMKRLREWLARCSKHETCQARRAPIWSRPDGFRLLDITSLRVVDASGHEPYVALSYTWAQVDAFEIKRDESYAWESLPGVMQDVISVIRRLELRINHLWIDRLCVEQEDPVQKKANIAAIGEIYGAAFATIVLAVPSEAHYLGLTLPGLPGLSAQRIPFRHVEKIGKPKIATTLPSLEMTIGTSKWSSRAWTFQEGLLSSSCIIFGPEQSYFECAEMACCESLKEPDMALSDQDHMIPYKSRLRNPYLTTYDFNSLYWRLVHDYTSRDMSLPSDSLNAFSAFAAEFERAGRKLTWGLPISDTVHHLLWEHEPWDFRPIVRRKDFPSWSWAGWSGTVAMLFPLDTSSDANYTCTMREEPPDGRILSCIVRIAQVKISGCLAMFTVDGAPGSSIMFDSTLDAEAERLALVCEMMEICRMSDTVYCLVVQRRGDYNEIKGSGIITLSDFEAARPLWQEARLV
ncbi:hypothetical protein MMC30_002021 [Trapelia coarctata]|nr:hypothetical protein [Trapelia coarctata]